MSHVLTEADKVACRAFAPCDRPATGAVRHPVLGAYPSCARCAEKLGVTLEPAEVEATPRTANVGQS